MGTDDKDRDRIFVRDGFRHYRRRYSLTEVRWGLATGAALLGIGGWVAWKGAHPDPNLFGDPTALLGTSAAPMVEVAAGAPVAPPSAGAGKAAAGDRGPLPALAGDGWREEKVATFDDENLYVKINGRADYFRSFGFKRLYSVLLVNEQDPALTIDVEMYDQGSGPNALGAYGGERAPTVRPEVTDAGLHHLDRNALYLARGPYYIRVIGSDESPAMTAALKVLADKVIAEVKGEPLPWAYGLYVGGMGVDPGNVAYFSENAFSLGFARDVWTARPAGKDADLELFVVALGDANAARALADKLRKAFLELGQPAGKADGVALVKDQFLGLVSAAAATERFAYGVRGAADKDAAGKELARVREALAKAPEELKSRARPAETAAPAEAEGKAKAGGTTDEGGYGEH